MYRNVGPQLAGAIDDGFDATNSYILGQGSETKVRSLKNFYLNLKKLSLTDGEARTQKVGPNYDLKMIIKMNFN